MRIFAFSLLMMLGCALAAQAQEQARLDYDAPRLTFSTTHHNFGEIVRGQVVSHTFVFENTGTAPLVLTKVETTCGCTATSWTRQPLQPGDKGEITVSFDSSGKTGQQVKVISVYSNALTPIERIKISAIVNAN